MHRTTANDKKAQSAVATKQQHKKVAPSDVNDGQQMLTGALSF
jgi:hypothetical protein